MLEINFNMVGMKFPFRNICFSTAAQKTNKNDLSKVEL